jgi:hypothetical protein
LTDVLLGMFTGGLLGRLTDGLQLILTPEVGFLGSG